MWMLIRLTRVFNFILRFIKFAITKVCSVAVRDSNSKECSENKVSLIQNQWSDTYTSTEFTSEIALSRVHRELQRATSFEFRTNFKLSWFGNRAVALVWSRSHSGECKEWVAFLIPHFFYDKVNWNTVVFSAHSVILFVCSGRHSRGKWSAFDSHKR